MNTRINSVLEDIRHQLEAEGESSDVTASGPDTPAGVGGGSTAGAEAGSGGAINPPNVSDTLDLYITEIADLLTVEYDKTPEEAMKFVFDAAKALSDEGAIPPIPDDDTADEEIAIWLGKAKSVQFAHQVMNRAREMMAK
jgi:hypothetical protein